MADNFSTYTSSLDSPARKAAAVTPHDTNELTDIPRAIYVGGAGNITMTLVGDSTAIAFNGATAGSILAVRPKLIKSTGTTATAIVALY